MNKFELDILDAIRKINSEGYIASLEIIVKTMEQSKPYGGNADVWSNMVYSNHKENKKVMRGLKRLIANNFVGYDKPHFTIAIYKILDPMEMVKSKLNNQ
jgi:hypothetical protein